MKRSGSRKALGRSFLKTPCFLLSAAVFVFSLAEAALRWDAMAPPFRIVFRLIGTGKLTAGEIFEAVRPEIISGALVYPVCVLLGALCALWGLGTLLFRRRGFTAAAMYLCAAVLTALSGGGTSLRAVHALRCVLTAGTGCLYAVRAALFLRNARAVPEPERGDDPAARPETAARGEDGAVCGDGGGARGGRLFSPGRPRLFKDEEGHVPLFDRGGSRGRRGQS